MNMRNEESKYQIEMNNKFDSSSLSMWADGIAGNLEVSLIRGK